MDLEKYTVQADDKAMIFEFFSEGLKGRILKRVKYSGINLKGVFNLSFGDVEEKTNSISDTIITNNGDSRKVLATVAATLYSFTEVNNDAIVIATGSTKARTRLYRMGITNNLELIQEDFVVYGLRKKKWQKFRKTVDYEAFLVSRKKR
jgi:hypothetical protein